MCGQESCAVAAAAGLGRLEMVSAPSLMGLYLNDCVPAGWTLCPHLACTYPTPWWQPQGPSAPSTTLGELSLEQGGPCWAIHALPSSLSAFPLPCLTIVLSRPRAWLTVSALSSGLGEFGAVTITLLFFHFSFLLLCGKTVFPALFVKY